MRRCDVVGSEFTCWEDGCGLKSVGKFYFAEIVNFSKVGDLNFLWFFF